MTALPRPPDRAPVTEDALDRQGEQDFLRTLAAAIRQTQAGQPAVLMHLEVVRAGDICTTCGASGLSALRGLLQHALFSQLGPTVPVCEVEVGALAMLLENYRPGGALAVATRLRSTIDKGVFRWHGHPFRLGAHLGVLELGPRPDLPELWLDRAREACAVARELGGSGIQLVELNEHAWNDIEREREWHAHLREVLG